MGSSKIIHITIGLLLVVSLYADEYQDWLNAQSTEYTSYKKSVDEEFSSLLKEEWKAFQSMYDPSPYKVKKPLTLLKVKKSVVISKKELSLSPKVKLKPIVKKPRVVHAISVPVLQPIVLVKKIKEKETEYTNLKLLKFDFYSKQIELYYDSTIENFSSSSNSKNIAKFWDAMSATKYKTLLKQIQANSDSLNLNGWAQYQFIYQASQAIYNDNSLSNMMTWFFLTKMNYDVKVAYGNNKVYLLSRVKHKLFQVSFFMIEQKKYYVMNPSGKAKSLGKIYTYNGSYPKSDKALSFLMPDEVLFENHREEKEIYFHYYAKKYVVHASYSKDLISFYKTFPQSDFDVYFEAKNSKYLSNSLLKSLSKYIKNMSELEAANFLLRFTQKAFKYKTDPDQFGYEKPMFPEEMLFYPYNDCEDRAVMYSYLIKNLLGLDIVGVKYSGHLATAVAFNSKVSGSGFRHKHKMYTIADPTYINANVGIPMHQYKNATFDIIESPQSTKN